MIADNNKVTIDWSALQRWSLIAGLAGVVVSILGACFDPDQFFRSYLVAFSGFLALALGSMAVWMIHNLTGGRWGTLVRPYLEAASRTLPLLALAFVPVAIGLARIYSWAGAEHTEELGFRAQYLNVPFFLVRALVCFGCWLLTVLILCLGSRGGRGTSPRAAAFSGPGLVIYGLTMTVAAVDWLMSLEPDFASTIFGVIVTTSQMLPALGLAIAVATWMEPGRRTEGGTQKAEEGSAQGEEVWNDLGNMLLTFVMLWTYMMFAQLLLVWSGNLPEEISWYLHRCEGGWQWIDVLLAGFYFALPFLLLLWRDVKRRPERLRLVALAVVVMSFVHEFWLVAPAYSPREFKIHWLDFTTLIGLGGIWLAYYSRQLLAVSRKLREDHA